MIAGARTPERTRRTVRRLIGAREHQSPPIRRAILELEDAAVAPLLEILVEEDGYAPAHAASLLGELRAPAAIPPMLELLRETEWHEVVHDAIIQALPKIGAPIVEPALQAYAACDELDFRIGLLDALARCGVQDDRIYARLIEYLDIEPDGAAMHLADYGDPRAIEHLGRAFDAYIPVPTNGPLGNQDLIELRCAIEQLGGALTPAQQQKYQEALEPLERWRRERARNLRPDRSARPGRNEPCWCGNGKKYKKCHLDADHAVASGEGAHT